MGKSEKIDFQDTLAKIISIIFHPLLMPVFGILIIFSAPTLFGYLPYEVKKLLFLIILINNLMLPLSVMPFLRYKNFISSWSIENRKERILPLLIITLLYSATSFIIFRFPIPVFLKSFILATFFLSLTVTIINFWWKISIHSVGVGALTGLVLILSLKMFSPLLGYLVFAIIASGLVLSSRLKLGAHNPSQVWVALFTGFTGLFFFMLFF